MFEHAIPVALAGSTAGALKKGATAVALLLGLVAAFFVQILAGSGTVELCPGHAANGPAAWLAYGLTPACVVARPWTLLTYAGAHAGIAHLLGNAILLFITATALEERVGPRRTVLAYWASVVAGGSAGLLLARAGIINAETVMIGASGGVFGVLAALAVKDPRARLPMPVPLGFFMILVRMPVIVGFGILVAFNVLLSLLQTDVAWYGHLGGALGGILVAKIPARAGPAGIALERGEPPNVVLTPTGKTAMARASESDEAEVRRAWLLRALDEATCPRCGEKVRVDGRDRVSCRAGHDLS